MRLFLFPYAGGGPAAFHAWMDELPPSMEAWLAHYPGRGSRHREAPIRKISALVEKLVPAIQTLLDRPFAFFGHSLGGLVAFELTRSLSRNNLPAPRVLFVSGRGAPHLADRNTPIHELSDTDFLTVLTQWHGTPSEVLQEPDIMQFFLPVLRADFEAAENYQYLPDAPLVCPIVAFGGLHDPRVSQEHLEGWKIHTQASFRVQYFPGDHFFINTAAKEVLSSMAMELASSHV
jgi:medium-chain acyl-[acyl-carrier-protein] hydrolase